MINPWNEWQRMVRAGTMLGETWDASHAVVRHRTRTIEHAIHDPLSADHAELGLMVSEKGRAFAAAGLSLTRDWARMQADLGAQATAVGRVMMGEVPSLRAAQAIVARGQRLNSAMLASTMRAMVPVHRAATANARRLGKKR